MDDATRAELAQLRRRAFGPDPDIADDPAAVDRLVALESLVLSEHAAAFAARHPPARATAGPGERAPQDRARDPGDEDFGGEVFSTHIAALPYEDERMPSPAAPDVAADPVAPASRRWSWHRHDGSGIALTAAVAAALIGGINGVVPTPASEAGVIEETTREAYSFVRDQDAKTLIEVPLDGGFDEGPQLPADEVPVFPSSGTVEWAKPLGQYYGWNLWIAGAKGAFRDEQCILVIRGEEAKGRCVVAALRPQSALIVSLPYTVIDPAKRPEGLVPGMRIGFWWTGDPIVRILLGVVPADR
ncbi:hypothetical protein G5T42_06960 [Microbacterium sp. 4R-513]|uniref:hypothetical protein n=1 Tax=Microbacterium sp. 4R-513 TaxID=2567934 RepID=UPI0013E1BCD3|nr:hypothetical protein [Microbacterium sp. 4R-513]QIG39259.1 hypothetical protein G5T42_06960 [Microbacterium sp. 4R-513]